MKEIALTQGKIALVDDEDYERVGQFTWSAAFFREANTWYAHRVESGRTVRMHRFIVGAERGEEVDHRNGDGLDNRRQNLRRCTRAENCRNAEKRTGLSRFKGVTPAGRGHWRAQITPNGKHVALGRFESEIEAARAYNEAALRYYGEFARLNQIDGDHTSLPKEASKRTTVPLECPVANNKTSETPSPLARLREHLASLEQQMRRCRRGHFARRSWLESQKQRLSKEGNGA